MRARNVSTSPHFIELWIGPHGVDAIFGCVARPDDPCRGECSRDCGEWRDGALCDCPKHDAGACHLLPWLTSVDNPWDELYRGSRMPLASGQIEVTWGEHGYEWYYPSDERIE